jgi:K+-transporting ATPase ATPase A chain
MPREAIKELGTNCGGFYNANSAHPFENPNPFSNFLEIFFLLLIPVALTRTFGLMVKDKRQGYAILATMASLWGLILAGVWSLEAAHPGTALKLAGAAMEGKETRFGVAASSLFATSTTGTSNRGGRRVPLLVHRTGRWAPLASPRSGLVSTYNRAIYFSYA